MKFTEASLYLLRIPFTEAFGHSAKTRAYSDSIVVHLCGEDGVSGYGEGVARPYVTGETVKTCAKYMSRQLWPKIAGIELTNDVDSDPAGFLDQINEILTVEGVPGDTRWHAARTGFELAIMDALLKRRNLSLAAILPPRRAQVTYSGVISSGPIERALRIAERFREIGFRHIKIKIGEGDERERVAAIRDVVGPLVSLRVDANGAYDVTRAVEVLNELAEFDVECAEQPIPPGSPAELARVRAESLIPLMVDESLVTIEDARDLIAAEACDFFNLRISKCGGIERTLALARMAASSGVRIQLGCQVGETAILSAAGRHVAASLEDLAFVEGSYGSLLLEEDVGAEEIEFGPGGNGPLLKGPGLGIRVREDVLRRYASSIITLRTGA